MTKSTVPASSSRVWKVTPLAVPGRCTIMLMPATRTRLPGGLATGVAVRVNGDRVGPDARRERAVGRVQRLTRGVGLADRGDPRRVIDRVVGRHRCVPRHRQIDQCQGHQRHERERQRTFHHIATAATKPAAESVNHINPTPR